MRTSIPQQSNSRRPRIFAAVVVAALAAALALHLRRPSAPQPPAPRMAARATYENRAVARRPSRPPGEKPEEAPSISGTVYDTRGEPVAEAAVAAATFDVAGNMPSTVGAVKSDARGRFVLRLAEGTYQLSASREGYGPATISAETGQTLAIVLPRAGMITGHVRDQRGAPVQRFSIDVVPLVAGDAPAASPVWSRAFDSPDGAYSAAQLPPEPVIIRARAEGKAPAYSAPLSGPPGAVREADLVLEEGCVLTGTALDGAGSPLPRVLVNVEERNTAGSAADAVLQTATQAESGDDGAFRLEHVPRGTLLVRGYDGDNAVTTVTVEVGECDALAPVRLVMSPGGGITGVARSAAGAPLAGARVTVLDRSVGIVNTRADEEGRFHFDKLPPGPTRLELGHAGQSAVTFVEVREGQTARQDMSLFAAGSGEIRGRVVAGSRPLSGARVFVASFHGQERGVAMYFPVAGEDGSFRVPDMPEGAYVVNLLSSPETRGVQVAAGQVASVNIDVAAAPTADAPRRPPPPRRARRDAEAAPQPLEQ
jgi:hypothetical protein